MSEDYFALLGLRDVSFSIDLPLMEKNYIGIQRSSHPDRFFSIRDKETAARHIAKVNKAYLILKSPESRAEYILSVGGVKLSDEDRSKIVEEIFSLKLNGVDVGAEVSNCLKSMEKAFAECQMYEAAIQLERLKYLKRMSSGIEGYAVSRYS
ncbi:co-chaperone protein HscB [Anaplasma platys]|uniref:Co-chaperone protein HscB n=1 Tax=Anaplasma platys TaxID=949 RepID=A0A858PYC9_9RICK|nr:Fe-S protein assembly co-chaperone HscB [Anaplasma platys]QJC27579.1 co-chaperone protein HscB [Anaplasma platys]